MVEIELYQKQGHLNIVEVVITDVEECLHYTDFKEWKRGWC